MKNILTLKNLALILLLFIAIPTFAQKKRKAFLKETRYWDREETELLSRGYVHNDPSFSYFGQKEGLWTFWYRNGKIKEKSYFSKGKYEFESLHYYPSGKLMVSTFFINGIEDSIYISYFENGRIAEKGNYKKGYKIGKWKYWFVDSSFRKIDEFDSLGNVKLMAFWNKNHVQTIKDGNGNKIIYFGSGKIKQSYSYKNGLLNGTFEEKKANKTTQIKGEYLNGKKHGVWEEYFLFTNQLQSKKTFDKDSLTGKYISYFENGKVNIQGVFKDNKKQGKWSWFDKNGRKDMVGEFKNDLQHGKWIFYYPSGQIKTNGEFAFGKKNGRWDFFYENGEKRKSGNYINDLKEGEWSVWFENKNLSHKGNYKANKEHGFWESWYEKGNKKDEGNYKNGNFDGNWKGWFPNNQQKYIGQWKNNFKTGKWKHWYSNGMLQEEGKYTVITVKRENKELEKEITKSVKTEKWIMHSKHDGSLVSEENYKGGKKSGTWRYYYPGGEIVSSEMNYHKGLLHGAFKTYTRTGIPVSEVNYKQGVKHGYTVIYNKNGKEIKRMKFKDGFKINKKSPIFSPF